jgi:hypothetical protein
MQARRCAVVWIDHHQARVFHFSAEDADKIVADARRFLEAADRMRPAP